MNSRSNVRVDEASHFLEGSGLTTVDGVRSRTRGMRTRVDMKNHDESPPPTLKRLSISSTGDFDSLLSNFRRLLISENHTFSSLATSLGRERGDRRSSFTFIGYQLKGKTIAEIRVI